jgi:hypothetical protein
VAIDCQSNKPVELTCYLDDVEHTPCKLISRFFSGKFICSLVSI